nr:uncharacterized mitochondrial protein AtMg00810-like [Tanacetum cinerariifolium]
MGILECLLDIQKSLLLSEFTTNKLSIPINMIPNGDEASTSHNVFNERLEDAYFDASTSFYDPSNVQTFYQPYPHEKKCTKDHPLHKIISDPKSSVRTRGQLANSCLFLCLLSSIEPANLAEALRDANPNKHHVSAIKRIFRYLKETINLGLWYPKDSGFDLTAYSDADHAGCHLDRKSTSGSVQFLGDKLVCWSSKKQNCVSISAAESEYVAVSGYCAQVLWMRTQLTDYGFFYDKVSIYCDSKSAIAISCNPVQHTRTKHIDV